MLKHVLFVFLASALVATAALAPRSADAKWKRRSAHSCTTPDGYLAANTYSVKNSTPGNIHVFCAIDDDMAFSKSEIETINVHVYQGWGPARVEARACVGYSSADWGNCGSWRETDGFSPGMYTIQPSTSALGQSGHFAYVEVRLPQHAELKGYFIRD